MVRRKMKCKIGKIVLKNPIIAASGTFGYGKEAKDFFDINCLGGFVTKTITLKPRKGNFPPRIYDLGFGVINSIGLENPGLKEFIKQYAGFLNKIKTHVFVSIWGKNLNEFKTLVKGLEEEKISGFELNFSCPNIKGEVVSADKRKVYKIIASLRRITRKTLIAKLSYSPQVKDVARAAQAAGADALRAFR